MVSAPSVTGETQCCRMRGRPLTVGPLGRMSNLLQQVVQEPLTGFSRVVSKINTLWLARTYPFASIGKGVWVHHSCQISRRVAPFISIGDDVIFHRDVWLTVHGVAETNDPVIILEGQSNIQRGCVFSARNQIHVERNTIFSPSVLVMDHNHAFDDVTRPIQYQGTTEGGRIRIGQGCWIGYGTAILCSKGELNLGSHCEVTPNTVVTRSFPPYSVISGNPARVVKQFDPVQQVWVMGSVHSMETEPTK